VKHESFVNISMIDFFTVLTDFIWRRQGHLFSIHPIHVANCPAHW